LITYHQREDEPLREMPQDMSSPEKSDVMKSVLKTLISISTRKTDFPFTVMTIEELIKRLEAKYIFLKNVKVNDDVYNEENTEVISVMSDLNAVPPAEVGKAIHAIIESMNRTLGENAGHFFIKEIRNKLTDDYLTVMKDMGVDLGMMQLESEIIKLERDLADRKK
jgi:hypothetical protein